VDDDSEVVDFDPITTEPHTQDSRFNPLVLQELARSALALALLGVFVLTITWAFLNVGTRAWGNTKQLLDVLIPAETAILGIAVGFYFALTK
jgi:hypothetical protein